MNQAIDPKEKIILALDLNDFKEARRLVRLLKDYLGIFKVGKQLFTSCGPRVVRMIEEEEGGRSFLDLKFHDIPHTVARAGEAATKLGVVMYTLHALGGLEMMRETKVASENLAREFNIPRPKILAVTILTSLDQTNLKEIGINSPLEEEVIRLAQLAQKAGVDGVVASPQEIKAIRKNCGQEFIIVTPGIRPAFLGRDDQRRVLSPKEAILAGANYLVIGRPILKAPNPLEAARKILEEVYSAS